MISGKGKQMTKEEIKEIRSRGYRYNKKLDVPTFKIWGHTCYFRVNKYDDDTIALDILSYDGEIYDGISTNLRGYEPDNVEGLKKNEIFLDHNLNFDEKDPFVRPVIDLLGAKICGNLITGFVIFQRLRLQEDFEKYCVVEY